MELADPAVVRLIVAREHPEGQMLVASPLDSAGGDDPNAVGVEQLYRHHPGVEPLLLTGILGLRWYEDFLEIQPIHQIQQETN